MPPLVFTSVPFAWTIKQILTVSVAKEDETRRARKNFRSVCQQQAIIQFPVRI